MQPAYANRNCFLADSGPRANNRFFSASERLGCARFLNAAAADSVLQCARGSRPRKKLRKQQRVVTSGGEKEIEEIYCYGDGVAATFSGGVGSLLTSPGFVRAAVGDGEPETSNNTCVTERPVVPECGSFCRENTRGAVAFLRWKVPARCRIVKYGVPLRLIGDGLGERPCVCVRALAL